MTVREPAKLLAMWKRLRGADAAVVAEGDCPTVDALVDWLAAATTWWSATYNPDGSGFRDAVAVLQEMLREGEV